MERINTTEALFLYIICGTADFVEFLITTVFLDLAGAGEFIKWFLDGITWATVGLWLKINGVPQLTFGVGSLGELVPVVNALPLRTISLYLTIRKVNQLATEEA